MFEHREADRVPITDDPWAGTIRRWHREGMPEGVDWRDYFGIDKIERISVDITPRYEEKILEETEDYIISTTPWGVTLKNFKLEDSTPEFLDFTITTPDKWEEAKKRMLPTPDRIDWDLLKRNYPKWKANGSWIQAAFWFGFDVTHSWTVGTETFLIALLEEPEWAMDMFNTYLDMCISLYEQIWDAGYQFDSIFWWDDMGYKNSQFFSLNTYRELLKPVHKRAVEWAHSRGVKAHLHSCGDIMPFVPELVEIGVDALNPLEVKAGMKPKELKQRFGSDLVFHGGVNAVLWDDKEAIGEEIRSLIPTMKENGGYIFSSDHSIPNSVSLENMWSIINLIKEVGKY
ncbi:uroporphyrinogen decarboxylase family protein [Neglectibacter timonensis]